MSQIYVGDSEGSKTSLRRGFCSDINGLFLILCLLVTTREETTHVAEGPGLAIKKRVFECKQVE